MSNKYKRLESIITSEILIIKDPLFDEIQDVIENKLKALYLEGKINIRDEFALQHKRLEFLIEKLLIEMGFKATPGRAKNLEDLIVKPQKNFKTQRPLVVEVKSGGKPYIERDYLRQLDDWVFELSGEEKARKGDTGNNYEGVFSYGELKFTRSKYKHPTPHKGVLIYNGPVGTRFNDRVSNCINPNDNDFVNKRFFCVIPFHVFRIYADKVFKKEFSKEELWEKIHNTSGLLDSR